MRKKINPTTYNIVISLIIAVMVLINVNLAIYIVDMHNDSLRAERFRFAALRSVTDSFITSTSDSVRADASGFITKGIDVFEDHRYTGPVLSRGRGTIQGPSGKETFYNLNMSGVVSIMRRLGYDYEYWVRDDGVKMFGKYVMVAANLDRRPRGSKTTCPCPF